MGNDSWKDQPRKENGQFTFKYNFWKEKLESMIELDENPEVSKFFDGGSYAELRKKYEGKDGINVHHTPAKSISPLPEREGPCIALDFRDHERTASYKNSKAAQLYRKRQKELIEQNHFLSAEIMDFNNLIQIAGKKYARAMLEKLEYDKELYKKGVINE